MKIAVSATGGSINGTVEEKFGRAPYYLIVESETMRFGIVSNPNVIAPHGAGPQTAQMIAEQGATVVITGQVGPKAKEALDAAGISVVEGISGKIKDAINDYLKQ
jgi:predicted Fe-Mo cluster-binding NifX family protein